MSEALITHLTPFASAEGFGIAEDNAFSALCNYF
jgi:hypothetical protein